MSEANQPELTVRLLELRRSADDPTSEEGTVRCPLSVDARGVGFCQRCARFERELEDGGQVWIECHVPLDKAFPRGRCEELMSTEVTCLDSELDAEEAVAFLELAGVTSAPVLDDNSVLVGVVSTAALTRIRLEYSDLRGFDSGAVEVEDVMSTQVMTLTQRSTLGEAARLMATRNVDRVPIVTDDGHLVGVISAMDLVRWMASFIP